MPTTEIPEGGMPVAKPAASNQCELKAGALTTMRMHQCLLWHLRATLWLV